ncbi:MAG: nucleoside hydrolase [Rhodoferax sp.]|nr:nucleoside hydrolase [Rhodoferax sp.]MCB2006375.1 nucleoside hydrolase [Rhodoferax sp.]MCB2027574.1 nucleoside hydrolase [Rhodoferax sp.]MCB2039569.1 nucleoside hydrolase [Rhodoferax sp.]MCP5263385.1 nucleoside hydrolase [Rhodoferax sp.]
MTTQPLPIIIDCDPGVDDSIGILLALGSPELEVRAVTTVNGNVPVATGTSNALRILELAGRSDIGVYRGCDRALLNKPLAGKFHGPNGLAGLQLPEPETNASTQHAVDRMAQELRRAGEQGTRLTICTLGPMTNLALLLRLHPELAAHVDRVVSMGGAFRIPGNRALTAEFNILADPHAAQVVYSAGLQTVLIPLDATHQAMTTPQRVAAMSGPGRVGQAVGQMLAHWDRNDVQRYGARGGPLHDPLVIAFLVAPALFETSPAHVFVEHGNSLCQGQTVADWYNQSGEPADAQIVTRIDADGIFALFAKRLQRLDPAT